MPVFLNFDDPEFDQHFDEILNSERDASWDVNSVVSDILVDVKKRGDEALIQLTDRFDKIKLTKEELSFSKKEIDELSAKIKSNERKALDLAASRIKVFHEKQIPEMQFGLMILELNLDGDGHLLTLWVFMSLVDWQVIHLQC